MQLPDRGADPRVGGSEEGVRRIPDLWKRVVALKMRTEQAGWWLFLASGGRVKAIAPHKGDA